MSASQIAASLQSVIEARATGLAEADLLSRLHTPEVDSLIEEITLADDIPAERKHALLAYVSQVIDLNDLEGHHERVAAGLLDDLARTTHRAECEHVTVTLGVLGLARALRPHLAVLAGSPDGVSYFVACAAVRDVTRQVTATALRSTSLRSQLGPNRHDLLVSLTGAIA